MKVPKEKIRDNKDNKYILPSIRSKQSYHSVNMKSSKMLELEGQLRKIRQNISPEDRKMCINQSMESIN